jgi:hypothetical protein
MMEVAYLAGLIDGDGCLQLRRHTNTKFPSFEPALFIASSDRFLLEAVASSWGGHIRAKKGSVLSRKTPYEWYLGGAKAIALLRDLRPHLILKSDRAAILLDYWDNCRKRSNVPPTPEMVANRLALSQRLATR